MDRLDDFRCNICGNLHELCTCDHGDKVDDYKNMDDLVCENQYSLERLDLKFTCRKIKKVKPTYVGGSPQIGLKITIEQADPEEILEELFKHFGEEVLIKFLKG
jgi:hypothetical protein